MDEQALNKKLAKWAGFEFLPKGSHDKFKMLDAIRYPDGCVYSFAPNFPESLDACFKWLVPKAIDDIMAEQECSSDLAYAVLFKKWLQELELIIPKAALALCLAISKFIEDKPNETPV